MNKYSIITLSFIILLLFGLVLVNASEMNNFAEAEKLVQERISCSDLTDSQLELIGDYYMEQMHPGEAHERMDTMMGGEGSESLKQVHINIAQAFYCGNRQALGPTMMSTLLNGSSYNYGMMQGRNYGMMGGYYPSQNYYSYNFIIWIGFGIIVLLIILIIILLNRKSRSYNGKRKSR